MDKILQEDIERFVERFPMAGQLQGTTFLITGCTGLIGSILTRCLLALDRNIRVVAPVRNLTKAENLLGDLKPRLRLVACNLATADFAALCRADYVVHCAAPTSSRFFVEQPVETFQSILQPTERLLEYARQTGIRGFVYLSSLEVYGTVTDDSRSVTEDVQGYVDPVAVRSSYPMAKRAAECLCHLYARQHGVPVCIARLTQTTGAGIAHDDQRVIAQFTRLATQGRDIVLHTAGTSARPYLYTTDAVSALLYILLKGHTGEAYNVANEDTYISARGLAEYLQQHFAPAIAVRTELQQATAYAPETRMRLSVARLRSLGWQPHYGLHDILEHLAAYLK